MDLNTITTVATPRRRADLPVWSPGDAWLAGGTWLFSEPQPELSRLIDITDLAWPSLQTSDHGLRIAATCTIAELAGMAFPVRWSATPLVNQCCRSFLASFKIWNVATVGGNLCLALPAGPMISLTTALDGVCEVWTPDGGVRSVAANDFVLAPRCNALKQGELLRAIDVPLAALRRRTAFRQISLSPLGRSGALVIGTHSPDDGSFAVNVTAATPRPVQLRFSGIPGARALREALETAIAELGGYYDDVHGSPAWRRQVTLQSAADRCDELAGSN